MLSVSELLLILDLWAHLNSAMNFFIYGVTHSGFRKAYKQIAAKVRAMPKQFMTLKPLTTP